MEVFDLLSSEYGWTTDIILKTTLHEINWRLKKIIKRINIDREFKMSIHGINTKETTSDNGNADITKEQQKAMDDALINARKRKALEYGGKINNSN